MKDGKPGRNAPAFILLVLSLGPNHGLGILKKMDEIVPSHRLDTAIVYRILKKMDKEAFVESEWLDSESGPKKKVYHITESGKVELAKNKKNIENTITKLQTFLEIYSKL